MNEKIHIGQLISEKLSENGRTVTWFASEIGCDKTNIYKIFQKPSIDVFLLARISKILNYDFLSHSANELLNDKKSVAKSATDV